MQENPSSKARNTDHPNGEAIVFDIGGTSIRSARIRLESLEILEQFKTPTPKGKKALISAIKDLVSDHQLPLSVSLPGNISSQGVMAPGSAENLGNEPGEFDNFNIKQALKAHFPNQYLSVQNDAWAQCLGGWIQLEASLINPVQLGYLGLGTGLGGAFLNITNPKHPSFFTDGHVFDVMLTHANIAEDLLSHRTIHNVTGNSPALLNSHDDQWRQFSHLATSMGESLGRLVQMMHSGAYSKQSPWPNHDIVAASEVTTYLIGGSLGSKGRLGKTIVSEASQWLRDKGCPCMLHQIPDTDKAALIGSAAFLTRIHHVV